MTLRIYGGSHESGLTPTPIVSVGKAPENFTPIIPVLVKEDRSWSITHAQYYTAYTLYTREYPTIYGEPGQLLICLLLPPTHILANGDGPLDVLNATLNLFNGLVPTTPIDNSHFAKLLNRYALEERTTFLPVMSGSNVAAYRPKDQNQLHALMRYSRYPILEKVARLELGMECESSFALLPSGKASSKPASKKHATQKPKDDDATVVIPKSNKEEEEKNGNFKKTAIIIGAAVLALILLFALWPKNKGSETSVAKATTEQAAAAADPKAEEAAAEPAVPDDAPPAEETVEAPAEQAAPAAEPAAEAPQMEKSAAIKILLGGMKGDRKTAEAALTKAEVDDLRQIGLNYSACKYDKAKLYQINVVISDLIKGKMTTSEASSKISNIKEGKS